MKKNTNSRKPPQQEPLHDDHVSITESLDEVTYGITAKGDICKKCAQYGGSMLCSYNHKEIKSLSEIHGDIASLERSIAGLALGTEGGGNTTATNNNKPKPANPFAARISSAAFIPAAASSGLRTRSNEQWQQPLGMRTRSQEQNRPPKDPFRATMTNDEGFWVVIQ